MIRRFGPQLRLGGSGLIPLPLGLILIPHSGHPPVTLEPAGHKLARGGIPASWQKFPARYPAAAQPPSQFSKIFRGREAASCDSRSPGVDVIQWHLFLVISWEIMAPS
ncbi:hypothetical protein CCHR01_00151 [Colletotrichum chrysophilum]|uniref:Uncharacterized protein n=1 Tax=Colletotrichum chrysophilum TaxID=1836956 RepID=A0AAD9B0M0_9PEZI|nr:hypothetical protein CCHR01_00151 [Colletotrichum chrysophilum]